MPYHSYSYRRRAKKGCADPAIPLPFAWQRTHDSAARLGTYLRSRMPLIRKDPSPTAKKISERGGSETSRESSLSTCGIHVSVGRARKYIGKDTWSWRIALRVEDPPGDRAGFTSLAAILRLLSHQHGTILSSLLCPSLSLSRYRSNFPSDVRRDFRESKDPFSSDLKPLVRHERARTFSPLSSSSPSLRPFIYSLAAANNRSCFLRRGIDRTFKTRGLLQMYVSSLMRSVRARSGF